MSRKKMKALGIEGVKYAPEITALRLYSDGSLIERRFLFGKIPDPTQPKKKITRIEAYTKVLKHKASLRRSSDRDLKVLDQIAARHRAADAKADQPEHSIVIAKREYQAKVKAVEPFLGFLAVLVSKKLLLEHSPPKESTDYTSTIKPWYLSDEAVEKAGEAVTQVQRKHSSGPYEIGYKKTPPNTRFTKSGNPLGRPRQVSIWPAVQDTINSDVKYTNASGVKGQKPAREHIISLTFTEAMQGNTRAIREITQTIVDLDKAGLLSPPPVKRRKKRPTSEQRTRLIHALRPC